MEFATKTRPQLSPVSTAVPLAGNRADQAAHGSGPQPAARPGWAALSTAVQRAASARRPAFPTAVPAAIPAMLQAPPVRQLRSPVPINDDAGLEREADIMGARALQAPAAPILPATAARSLPGPVQRQFQASSETEFNMVRAYVAEVRPDLLAGFDQTARSDVPVDLRAWLAAGLGVTIEAVHDWQRGIVHSRSLFLDGEEVRGSADLPDHSDDDLVDFEIGLSEANYSGAELAAIDALLNDRRAPHDQQRRALLAAHHDDRIESRRMDDQDDDDSDRSWGYEDEGSGTETDGSDTEDDERYRADKDRQSGTAKRLAREKRLLKPQLTTSRLGDLRRLIEQQQPQSGRIGKAKKASKASRKGSEEDINKLLFSKGKRPGKERLYRKEAAFRRPDVPVAKRAELPEQPDAQQTRDLATLNALLSLNVPIALAQQAVRSRFVVAQYRGLFYGRNSFDQRSRARHRDLDETNQPVFSSAALAEGRFGAAGYYYLSGAGRPADLAAYQRLVASEAERIRTVLLQQRQQAADPRVRGAVGRNTANFQPQSLADIGTHLYSQDYDAYHQALADYQRRRQGEPSAPLDPLFAGLPNSSNPKVSTGDVPTHAARYAYGLKPYAGHEDQILDPDYDRKGKPRHPYSGKIYVSVHPLTDYDEQGPQQLVDLQRQHRINIAQVILPEHEAQFEALIPAGRIKAHFKAKFLNFNRPYKPVFAEKYGLSEALFADFKQALEQTDPGSDERLFVEALLSSYLAMHSEIRAIETATRIAREQGATLVYRTGPAAFGLAPAPLHGEPSPPAAVPSLEDVLNLVAIRQGDGRDAGYRSQPAEGNYGDIIGISGQGLACYIRSLVTAASRLGHLDAADIEGCVNAVQRHLAETGLRIGNQNIDAGGLVAAEVRRVLHEMLQGFDPQVHIVMQNQHGIWTDFIANMGATAVYLRYTPGHFDLLTGPHQ